MNAIMRRSPTVGQWIRTIIELYMRRHTLVEQLAPAVEGKAAPVLVDPLSPRGIADATARLLWIHRGSLKVDTQVVQQYNRREIGDGAVAARTSRITMPGGIRVEIGQNATSCTVSTPHGQQQSIDKDDFGSIEQAWQAIQGMGIMEALGMEVPDTEEPQWLRTTLAEHIGVIVETNDLQDVGGTYRIETIDDKGQKTEQRTNSGWKDLGGGIWFDKIYISSYSGAGEHRGRLLHPNLGVLIVPYGPIFEGYERRRLASFAQALGIAREQPVHLPMPKGNAQAARILRICREAVAAEPELRDANGTEIAPLVNRHLPELMRIHARAAEAAPAEDLAGIDADLMRGIETVRRAVDEALQVSANLKRDALRTQLRFLETRHPEANVLLPVD